MISFLLLFSDDGLLEFLCCLYTCWVLLGFSCLEIYDFHFQFTLSLGGIIIFWASDSEFGDF